MPNIDIPEEFAGNPLAYVKRMAPEMTAALRALTHAVHEHTILPWRISEAARARVAEINGCLACQKYRPVMDDEHGAARGPAPGETVYANVSDWRTSSEYDVREKLAIEFAERFSLSPDDMGWNEEFWGRFRAHFSDAEVLDLTISVAMCIANGRFTHVLGLDQVSCSISEASAEWGLKSAAAE